MSTQSSDASSAVARKQQSADRDGAPPAERPPPPPPPSPTGAAAAPPRPATGNPIDIAHVHEQIRCAGAACGAAGVCRMEAVRSVEAHVLLAGLLWVSRSREAAIGRLQVCGLAVAWGHFARAERLTRSRAWRSGPARRCSTARPLTRSGTASGTSAARGLPRFARRRRAPLRATQMTPSGTATTATVRAWRCGTTGLRGSTYSAPRSRRLSA